MRVRSGGGFVLGVVAAAVLVLGGCAAPSGSGSSVSGTTGTSGTNGTSASAGTAGTAVPARGAGVAVPTLRGPIVGGARGGPFLGLSADDLAARGYVEEEYLLSGTASAYRAEGPLEADGRWRVEADGAAPYVTRLLVRRPADPAAFDGTVVVEWLNVTSGRDNDVEWAHARDALARRGTAWVGVSAQAVGVEGGPGVMTVPGVPAIPLTTWDPERYGELRHPGDDHSYDLFSQVAAALRRPVGAEPLGGARPQLVLGAGESQSGARLLTYVDAVHPLADVYDGFLIHSRSGGGAALRREGSAPAAMPEVAAVRDDLDVPVLQFVTESDLFGLGFAAARQPDTDRVRTWEVAGTAHLDQELLDAESARALPPPNDGAVERACGRVNAGPQGAVLSKALDALATWAAGGAAPAPAPPLQVRDGAIVRDELGLAIGGVRTPAVDAPTAVLRGDPDAPPTGDASGYVCALFGSTRPLEPAVLAARYPTHDAYVDAVRRSADAAVAAGHLLPADAAAYVAAAGEQHQDLGKLFTPPNRVEGCEACRDPVSGGVKLAKIRSVGV